MQLSKEVLHKKTVKAVFNSIAGKHSNSRCIYRDSNLLEKIYLKIKYLPYGTIVDLGSGEGVITNFLFKRFNPDYNIIGIDISRKMIKTAKTNGNGYNISYVLGDIDLLPFRLNSISLFTLRFVLHHMQFQKSFLKEIYDKLIPGGLILICEGISSDSEEADKFINYLGKKRDPSHIKYLKKSEILNMLEEIGFEIVETDLNAYNNIISLREWAGVMGESCYFELKDEFSRIDSKVLEELSVCKQFNDILFSINLGIFCAKKTTKIEYT